MALEGQPGTRGPALALALGKTEARGPRMAKVSNGAE